jgi:hypothetical protein
MLLNPAIIALLAVSSVSLLMLAWSSLFGWRLLRHWDIRSGSEQQLVLERRTYLISTLLIFVFVTEAASLLLFVFTAEQLSELFAGAMCAVGALNVNSYGWPALLVKIAIFFSAAAWLILNHLDTRGYDYPLTRIKYRMLMVITPLVAAEAWLQLRYFLGLDADVITSCCGSLFGGEDRSLASELASIAPQPAMTGFYLVMALTIASGIWYHQRRSGAYLFSGMSLLAFIAAITFIISCISLYVYEHPHHHCPFCVLKQEYYYQGYLLYIPLIAATAFGLGVGIIHPFRHLPSLQNSAAAMAGRMASSALMLFLFFTLWATVLIWQSNLRLLDW